MCTVAGIDINMFAPQTLWAVVGESIAYYFETAMFTGKIFNGAFESHKEATACPVPNASRFGAGCSHTKSSTCFVNVRDISTKKMILFLFSKNLRQQDYQARWRP